jgi:hypothetical protein
MIFELALTCLWDGWLPDYRIFRYGHSRDFGFAIRSQFHHKNHQNRKTFHDHKVLSCRVADQLPKIDDSSRAGYVDDEI